MPKIDRLSALMSRFELSVTLCDPRSANFQIVGQAGSDDPTCLILAGQGGGIAQISGGGKVLLSAHVTWGGAQNPLFAALPRIVRHSLEEDDDMRAIVTLLLSEQRATRCGSASVLNRLAEVLVVRLMRGQIEAAHVETGLLGGLADPRLSRAIVAIHDTPGHAWRVDALAEVAGLSVSHFSELFREAVGVTPLAYLRKWRLVLARQDIERGDRVQRVAQRYCYGSTEALSRAMSQAYGASPMQIRKTAQAAANA
ncbi:AraC family transcriptional regulator [uncultured Tateyamaria sp.]|uniref:helix-turn-helix domain-containing protein n=1 Tax=uncultured Tateyamaria sp. TaxID=455651 RepID=UPI002633E91B|nr:AraC family transcriptional regulator [uncultured Tateyamaria sp.]